MSSLAPRISRPFLPSDIKREPPGRSFTRAAYAIAKNALDGAGQGGGNIAEERWPSDRQAIALTRAATSPASSTGWGSQLSGTSTADFIGSLVGKSAGARLINAGLRVNLDGVSAVLIPHRSTALPNVDAHWVAELGAYPVRQYAVATSQVGPTRKLITGSVISRELADYANGEEIVGQLLREDAAASLDASLFSNATASSTRPAGLLNGVSALTATTGGGEAALRGDLSQLAAIATAVGSGSVVFICSPSYAVRMATYPTVLDLDNNQFQVWPSIAIPDGTVICIAPAAFVSGFGAVPRIEAARDATLHLEDTTPLAISATGTPNTVAAPVISTFQSDSIALQVILDAAWTLRASGAVSWLTGATW